MNVRRCMTLLLLVGLALSPYGDGLRVRAEPTPGWAISHDAGPQAALWNDRTQNAGWWAAAQEAVRQSEYHVTWQDETYLRDLHAAYQAPNRAHNLRTYFVTDSRSAGIRVLPRTGDAPAWEWGLSLVGYGHAGNLRPIGSADLVPKDNRIEYRRSTASGAALPLVEWYVNDERGLEQGFTLTAPPLAQAGESGSQIVLELALSGNLTPSLVDGGAAIEFTTPGGVRVLRYGNLYAYDATGRALPASLDLDRCASTQYAIRIELDAAYAVYPVTIDPLATSPGWTAESNQADTYFGCSVGTAGDVNGDGYDDVVVGAYAYDGGQGDEGRAYVYHGSASGLRSTAAWTAEGNQGSAQFGWSAGTAGDVNGDGYDDLVVGAHRHDAGQENEGRAYVYHGSASGLDTVAAWIAEGNQADGLFGWSVGTAGDVNGDGYDDLVVGARSFDSGQINEGLAYVYHGSASGLSTTAAWTAESNQAEAYFGCSVGTAGDVNGDGYDDLIVGAHAADGGQADEGRAYVYHGSASGLRPTAAWTAESNQAYAVFGWAVSTAGDVNGDGYADVIVGAYRYDAGQENEGRAYVYHGSASGLRSTAAWTAESNQAGAVFGRAVGTAGDVDGDGYDEVAVGAPYYDAGQTDEGRAYVYHGSASGLAAAADWIAEGNLVEAAFGFSVGTAGDVNGDGYDDLIVGAEGYNGGQPYEGRAYVYYGIPPPPPAIALDKTASASAVRAGETVVYSYYVTNPGGVQLSNVRLTDNRCSPVTFVSGDGNGNNRLDTNETWTYRCSQALNATTTNTATVSGTDLSGGTVSAQDAATVTVIHPAIALDKTASASTVRAGETVVYSYYVTNPGDVQLSNVRLTDNRCSPVTFVGGDGNGNNRLDTNETWTYRCSQALNATTTNTATVSGTDLSGGTVSAQDAATVTVIHPAIALDKTASASTVRAGETVVYTYRVTNPGDVRLSNVSLADNRCSAVTYVSGDGNGNNRLDTNETWTYRCSQALNATTTNVATAQGTDTLGDAVSAQDSATVIIRGEGTVYLPMTFKLFMPFAPPCGASNGFCEDNDEYGAAYGRLQPGVSYRAYPDDPDDYYFFHLDTANEVVIELHGYRAIGQLHLYRLSPSGERERITYWSRGGSEMEIRWPLQAGTYFVGVHTTENNNSTHLYTLLVNY